MELPAGQLTCTPVESDASFRQISPFLNPGAVAKANTLAIIQLSKDDFLPVYLRDTQGEHDGYKEGHVLNTRFGSFPHSTLIGVPWGSQVRASVVDTGTRGRKKQSAPQQPQPKQPDGTAATSTDTVEGTTEVGTDDRLEGLKRKRATKDEGEKRVKSSAHCTAATTAQGSTVAEQQAPATDDTVPEVKAEAPTRDDKDTRPPAETTEKPPPKPKNPPTAQSGFVHILPPTPEMWTTSLPHRTQVVYTPDYSYILQRLRARPGTRLIEAGSGSGSFTHASARAVYDGAPALKATAAKPPTGKVFSFEFHEQRFHKMRREVQEHGLNGLVEVNHRDVYKSGFLVDGKSPEADAVFLDLPAPWLALPHLSRRKHSSGADTAKMEGIEGGAEEAEWVSPLNPNKSVYLCTFSPCIEQVTRTVSEMRRLGWVEIEMVEIAHRRMHVFREKLGLDLVSDRGQQLAPKSVAEALVKLREVEVKSAEHIAKMANQHLRKKPKPKQEDDEDYDMEEQDAASRLVASKADVTGNGQVIEEESKRSGVKPFMQGQVVTRSEPEVKTHTSYLVFAILPREWTEEEEAAAAAKWPTGTEPKIIGGVDRESRKQLKRELLQAKRKKNKKEPGDKGKAKAAEATKAGEDKAAGAEDVKMEGVVKTEVQTYAA